MHCLELQWITTPDFFPTPKKKMMGGFLVKAVMTVATGDQQQGDLMGGSRSSMMLRMRILDTGGTSFATCCLREAA